MATIRVDDQGRVTVDGERIHGEAANNIRQSAMIQNYMQTGSTAYDPGTPIEADPSLSSADLLAQMNAKYQPFIGPDGQVWAPSMQSQDYGITTPSTAADLAPWMSMIGNNVQYRDGVPYVPQSILEQIAAKTNDNGFIGNFLNGPGAVLLPLAIGTAGVLGAGAGAGGAAAPATAPASLTAGGELVGGTIPGLGSVASTGAAGIGEALGAGSTAAGGGLADVLAGGAGVVPGLGSVSATGTQGIIDALGAGSGLAGMDLSGPVLTGGASAGGGLTLPGFNPLDPSTFGGSSSGGAGTATGGAISSGAQSVLGKLLSGGDLTADDWAKLGGTAAGSLLSYFGNDAQNNALTSIYNQQRADRLPALNKFNDLLANPDAFYNSDIAQGASRGILQQLSGTGNPALNPGSLVKADNALSGLYLNTLNTLRPAAYGTAGTEAAVGTNASQTAGAGYDALGYALGNLSTPQNSLQDLLKQLNGGFKVSGSLV